MYTDEGTQDPVERDLTDLFCLCYYYFSHLSVKYMIQVLKASLVNTNISKEDQTFSRNSSSLPHKCLNLLILNSQGAPAHRMTYTRIMTTQKEEWVYG